MTAPDGRRAILDRIRRALRNPRVERDGHVAVPGSASGSRALRQWLPSVPPSCDGQIALFRRNCEELRAEFLHEPTLTEAGHRLGNLALEAGWGRVAAHRAPALERLLELAGLSATFVGADLPKAALAVADVGITLCDCLVAQTGSILLTSRSAGGRALSVLPPHHVAVAFRDQVVPDLPAAFETLAARYGGDYPSMMTFITGPSRTGDIERILVLGAHGPRRLTVLLVDAPGEATTGTATDGPG